MLTLTLHVKPLSVNEAWRGRHYPTAAKTAFETRLRWSLPKVAVVGRPYYRVRYEFHLKNFALTDWDNLPKITQDCLVARGILSDDRLIVAGHVFKFPAKADKIVVAIASCSLADADSMDFAP